MKIIKSHILDEAARASKRWEDANMQMRRHCFSPPAKVVTEWNAARRHAEEMTAKVLK